MRASVYLSFFAGLLILGLDRVNAFEVPEVSFPALPKLAPSPEGFVPQGWMIETQSVGDLNGDKLPDLLLVLRQDDPANVVANDHASPGVPTLDTNPRILAAAFRTKGGGYQLILENHDFIPRYDTPTIDDPFGRAEIADGAVSIGLHFWANAGSWYTDDTDFIFKFRDSAFRLVGYRDFTTKRNTGQTWELDVDYLKREAVMTLGSFSDDEVADKTYRKSLPTPPLPTIEELGSGWDFQPDERDLSWWGLTESQ